MIDTLLDQLIKSKNYLSSPTWSPDGVHIAYSAGSEIKVLKVDKYSSSKVSFNIGYNCPLHPDWSPDGKKILYANRCADVMLSILYVQNPNPYNPYLMMRWNSSMNDIVDPTWSPDGKKIAFSSPTSDATVATPQCGYDDCSEENYEIYIVDSNGSNLKRLTYVGDSDRSPSWSPDGEKIVFESSRSGISMIYMMNADGSSQRLVANQPGHAPDWSPDGRQIAFVSGSGDEYFTGDIFTMNIDGTQIINLTNSLADDGFPAWQP